MITGTGKTVTGIKVAYWFVRMNKDSKSNGGSHGQVLYCGPSNSSVDVAASEYHEVLYAIAIIIKYCVV